MRYSEWFSVAEIDTNAPESSGLFQIKLRRGLITYPRGKSAMVYYGYAEALRYGLEWFRKEIAPLFDVDEEILAVRWMVAEDTLDRFKKHLDQFCSSFGGLPIGNELFLQKSSEKKER